MQRNNLYVVHLCVEVYTMLNCHLTQTWIAAARAIVLARAAVTDEVADHTLVKVLDTYNTAYEVDRKRALGIILSQSRQQDHEDAKVLEEAKRITEARLDTKIGEEAELPISAPAVAAPAEASRVLHTSSSPLAIPVDVPAPVATPTPAPPVPVVAPVAAAPSGPRGPRVYSRAALLAQQVHAIGSTAGVRTSKRVDQLLEEYGVRSKPKVPTQAVCAEHLELRKEVITLIQLQKQVNVDSISHKVTLLYALGY
jgi:DNA methyltransferase 1-associated protein 1